VEAGNAHLFEWSMGQAFVDRKKDALWRWGENISSYEVEKAINAHPKVLESAAVAVQSEQPVKDGDEFRISLLLPGGKNRESRKEKKWGL
jgi:crotonobetaine/carnitine-CoA ligase